MYFRLLLCNTLYCPSPSRPPYIPARNSHLKNFTELSTYQLGSYWSYPPCPLQFSRTVLLLCSALMLLTCHSLRFPPCSATCWWRRSRLHAPIISSISKAPFCWLGISDFGCFDLSSFLFIGSRYGTSEFRQFASLAIRPGWCQWPLAANARTANPHTLLMNRPIFQNSH
jgi:hypothetical protein